MASESAEQQRHGRAVMSKATMSKGIAMMDNARHSKGKEQHET